MTEGKPGATSAIPAVLGALGVLALIGGGAFLIWIFALLNQENVGPAEAARLTSVVEDLPGVESAEGEGSGNISYTPKSSTSVTMSPDATPEQLETVLITWRTAANPDDERSRNKWLYVSLDEGECGTGTTGNTSIEQLEDTAKFLPLLCAQAPGASVRVDNDDDERTVSIDYPEGTTPEPLDLDALRLLPGVTTDANEWEIAGVIYDWGTPE